MHQNKTNVKELTRQVVKALSSAQIVVEAEPWLAALMGEEAASLFQQGTFPCDAVVSVGGDGTLLRANQMATDKQLPLIGVNIGRMGFLAELELEQLPAASLLLRKDQFSLENRMMLKAKCDDGSSLFALNDVVVSRGGYSRLIAVKAWVDQELIGRYMADGLIVSTATGSTGYSLSAGGPIVCPGVDCIILCPVCPHSLQHRPVIISPKQTVTLELDCDLEQKAQLSVDGQKDLFLSARQKVTVTRAEKQALFIRLETKDFFSIVKRKLSEWSR